MSSYPRQLCLDQHGAAVVEWCQLLMLVLKQLGLIEQDLVQYSVQLGTHQLLSSQCAAVSDIMMS